MEAAFSNPENLVSRFEPLSRVHGDRDNGFPTVLLLDQSLAIMLLPKAQTTIASGPSFCLPLFTFAMLSYSVFAMSIKPEALPPELAMEGYNGRPDTHNSFSSASSRIE